MTTSEQIFEPFNWTAERLVMCPRCEARPGRRCVTVTGRETTDTHLLRWQPLAQAYSRGYHDGYGDADAHTPGDRPGETKEQQ